MDVVSGDGKSLHVDQRLIEGPNANQRGKFWIPLILAAQVGGWGLSLYCIALISYERQFVAAYVF